MNWKLNIKIMEKEKKAEPSKKESLVVPLKIVLYIKGTPSPG